MFRKENNALLRKNVGVLSPVAWHPAWEVTMSLTSSACSELRQHLSALYDGWPNVYSGVKQYQYLQNQVQVVSVIQYHCNCADGAVVKRIKLTEGHKKQCPCLTPESCLRSLSNALVILRIQHSACGSECQCEIKSVKLKGQLNIF